MLVLQVDQHDEEDEEEGLFLQQICHHKVTGERLTTIKLNNGKLYNMVLAVKKINDVAVCFISCLVAILVRFKWTCYCLSKTMLLYKTIKTHAFLEDALPYNI